MKKIPSLFQRDYTGNRQVIDAVTPGCEWVIDGEGDATVKFDGTSCMARDGVLYKRFDRKVTKQAKRRGRPFTADDAKPAPENWEPCEPQPNEHTGHWPGWVPVGDGPEDKWHREALAGFEAPPDGTYELIGPKIQGNPYGADCHELCFHGSIVLPDLLRRSFDVVRAYLSEVKVGGIVWHHPDGRMAKIKRRDFGIPWPVGGDA